MFFKKRKKYKTIQVGAYKLIANSEHPLETYLKTYKYYSRNFPRIAKLIERKYAVFSIIDVGANIGDTVALLRSENITQMIHAIEGNPFYFEIMQSNLKQFRNVKSYLTLLGDESKAEYLSIEAGEGTGKVRASAEKTQTCTLDDLITSDNITDVKLLKTDTDGFDFKIIRGGLNFIELNKPILFFEYDAIFLEEQNDDGITLFKQLQNSGYNFCIFYDNYGKMLLSLSVKDIEKIQQLYAYMRKREGAFEYFDVCVFHTSDNDLAEMIIEEEMKFFH